MKIRNWTATELSRIRKANTLKEKQRKEPNRYILCYFSGGNLMLIDNDTNSIRVLDQTGAWFNVNEPEYNH